MAAHDLDFPRILYLPEGEHCKVDNEEEYDRAKAAGWEDDVPKDWNNVPDPDNPGGTLPPKPTRVAPPAEDTSDGKRPRAAAKTSEPHDLVLEGTVAEVTDHVEKLSDFRQLQNLRLQETKGADRVGVLKAIDDRLDELKDPK